MAEGRQIYECFCVTKAWMMSKCSSGYKKRASSS